MYYSLYDAPNLTMFLFQPKPILVDKQFSEPNSPITKTFETVALPQKRPPMHRGYSDLGNRIKKRVTLRLVQGGLVNLNIFISHANLSLILAFPLFPSHSRSLSLFLDTVQYRPNMLAIIQFNMMDVVTL